MFFYTNNYKYLKYNEGIVVFMGKNISDTSSQYSINNIFIAFIIHINESQIKVLYVLLKYIYESL